MGVVATVLGYGAACLFAALLWRQKHALPWAVREFRELRAARGPVLAGQRERLRAARPTRQDVRA